MEGLLHELDVPCTTPSQMGICYTALLLHSEAVNKSGHVSPADREASIIDHYHHNSPLNITTLSTKLWYKMLLLDRHLMSLDDGNSP